MDGEKRPHGSQTAQPWVGFSSTSPSALTSVISHCLICTLSVTVKVPEKVQVLLRETINQPSLRIEYALFVLSQFIDALLIFVCYLAYRRWKTKDNGSFIRKIYIYIYVTLGLDKKSLYYRKMITVQCKIITGHDRNLEVQSACIVQ